MYFTQYDVVLFISTSMSRVYSFIFNFLINFFFGYSLYNVWQCYAKKVSITYFSHAYFG
jgi:hypothetical protein